MKGRIGRGEVRPERVEGAGCVLKHEWKPRGGCGSCKIWFCYSMCGTVLEDLVWGKETESSGHRFTSAAWPGLATSLATWTLWSKTLYCRAWCRIFMRLHLPVSHRPISSGFLDCEYHRLLLHIPNGPPWTETI